MNSRPPSPPKKAKPAEPPRLDESEASDERTMIEVAHTHTAAHQNSFDAKTVVYNPNTAPNAAFESSVSSASAPKAEEDSISQRTRDVSDTIPRIDLSSEVPDEPTNSSWKFPILSKAEQRSGQRRLSKVTSEVADQLRSFIDHARVVVSGLPVRAKAGAIAALVVLVGVLALHSDDTGSSVEQSSFEQASIGSSSEAASEPGVVAPSAPQGATTQDVLTQFDLSYFRTQDQIRSWGKQN